MTKTCSKCQTVKPLEDFYLQPSGKHGRQAACAECHREAQRERLSDPDMLAAHNERTRRAHYRRRYGITVEDYDRMLADQGGVCAICGQPPKKAGRRVHVRLAVDHDHVTGKVRGLLCSPCNRLLHKLETGGDWMSKAVAYLS